MTERDIFLAVIELPAPEARAEYLDRVCGGNAALRGRVEALLRSHDSAGSFLGAPAVAPPEPDHATTRAFEVKPGPGAAAAGADTPGEAGDEEPLTFLAPPGRPDSLGRIGHYEVLQVLGRGAFGIVFRAFDDTLHRVVAVKVLSPQMAATSPARKRFLREARTSAQVRHENVVQVYEVGEVPLPYLVMEFIPGETLQQRLDRVGPVEPTEVVRVGRQVAEGLAAAHATDLIHRDIKPGNILLEGGQLKVKITDFGLARAADDASISQSGIIAGTPMYMAPEQAKGETLDQRADLFSLGSVLYQMVTGRPPFRANGTMAVLQRVAHDTPRPIREIIPETPQWLCDIIAKLHAKNPHDRFQSARQVADLLGRCQEELKRLGTVLDLPELRQAASESPPADTASPPPARRPPLRISLGAAAGVLLAIALGLGGTEVAGVTNVRGTVIRLFSPAGTLVVEVDDPGVSVQIDNEDLVITGAGVKELRLKPGKYTVEARKDGKVVSRELVTVTTNGRQVVRITQEAAPPLAKDTPTDWERAVAAMPVAEQVKSIRALLKERNPEYTGEIRFEVDGDRIVALSMQADGLRDLSPVRACKQLDYLECTSRTLQDLSPLRRMRVGRLDVRSTGVRDLSPIKEVVGLIGLDLTACLEVADLTPLTGMRLQGVTVASTTIKDLSPLKGMPLQQLNLESAPVSDLAPLAGMPLTEINYKGTEVSDVSVLKSMPLKTVICDFQPARDADVLRAIKTLETINGKPAAEFWEDVRQK